jgi:hypothetical protein
MHLQFSEAIIMICRLGIQHPKKFYGIFTSIKYNDIELIAMHRR